MLEVSQVKDAGTAELEFVVVVNVWEVVATDAVEEDPLDVIDEPVELVVDREPLETEELVELNEEELLVNDVV